MLYSKVDVQAFATASVTVTLCSLVIKGTQWRSQELWMRDEKPKVTRDGMWGVRGSPALPENV